MTEHVANQLRNVQAEVEHILQNFPAARDCDKQLYTAYLRRYSKLGEGFLHTIGCVCDAIMEAPTPETLSRARRKIQEAGRWVGTRRAERAEEAQGVSEWAVNG